MPVVATAALSGSDLEPVWRSVQRTGEARGLDEHRRDLVALGPVLGQLPTKTGEDVRAQVGDRDPRQDEEPRVRPKLASYLIARARNHRDRHFIEIPV